MKLRVRDQKRWCEVKEYLSCLGVGLMIALVLVYVFSNIEQFSVIARLE